MFTQVTHLIMILLFMSNIHILNLSAYSPPTITESKKNDFVEYGEDNNYFQFLIDRFLYSNTNNAIITGVANEEGEG